jgi:hypothetical protein
VIDLDDDLLADGLTLLHHDRDFDVIAEITGQPTRWYGSG